MSLRRLVPGAKPPGLFSIGAKEQPTNKPSAPRSTPNRAIAAGFLCLLVTGVYLSQSPNNGDTQSPNRNNEGAVKSSHLRSSSVDNDKHHVLVDFRPIHETCTVWIAPSSINGLKGFGVFTTRDLAADEHILGVPDGVSIPIIGYWERDGGAAVSAAKDAWMAVWDNYWWGSGVADHVSYEAGTDVTDFQIAFGALPNHHCVLDNLDYVYPHPPYDDSMVDRFSDPGAGAFTYSRGRQFTVDENVKAGSEIFLNYGYCRHKDDQPDWVRYILMPSDFSKAASLIWQTLQQKDGERLAFDEPGNLIPPENMEAKILGLLPQNKKELQEMKDAVDSKTELTQYLAEYKGLNPHTPEWIEQNGLCLENLLPTKSTLAHAGQGAFAQYFMHKGDVIMPAPLLQIIDRRALHLWDQETGQRVNDQLLLNYCFGHAQSTLLLCPYTQLVLVNHSKSPNAEIRWSRGWDPTSDAWRRMSLEEIANQPGRGLAFELVALRDILPGEEVFIDYGDEWENAWNDHVKNWHPQERPRDWFTVTGANAETDRILPEFIAGDLRGSVDHPYLFTACQYHTSSGDRRDVYAKRNKKWRDLSDDDILAKYAEKGDVFGYPRDDLGYSKHADTSHWPCTVLLQENGQGVYTVRIHQNPWEDEMAWETNDVPRILTGYQRSDIHYFVQPYQSDQQLPGAFRHPLGIPDGMFPEHWKNLK